MNTLTRMKMNRHRTMQLGCEIAARGVIFSAILALTACTSSRPVFNSAELKFHQLPSSSRPSGIATFTLASTAAEGNALCDWTNSTQFKVTASQMISSSTHAQMATAMRGEGLAEDPDGKGNIRMVVESQHLGLGVSTVQDATTKHYHLSGSAEGEVTVKIFDMTRNGSAPLAIGNQSLAPSYVFGNPRGAELIESPTRAARLPYYGSKEDIRHAWMIDRENIAASLIQKASAKACTQAIQRLRTAWYGTMHSVTIPFLKVSDSADLRWEKVNQQFVTVLDSLDDVPDADRMQHQGLVALQANYEAIAETTATSSDPDQQVLDRQSQAAAKYNVGIVALVRGDIESATRAFGQAQATDPDRGDYRTVTTVIDNVQQLRNQLKSVTPVKEKP